ncbi:MAG: AMP-binding protein [Spirochaetes bacterium]|nr:AMP-binding protein [Spirochaetota bacterium]
MYQLERFTLQEVFLKSTSEYQTYPALGMLNGRMYSYKEVKSIITGLIHHLRTIYGVGPGSHVALISENRPEWPMAYLAVTSLGAVIVPILTDFSSEAIRNIIIHAECTLILASQKMREKIGTLPGVQFLNIEKTSTLTAETGVSTSLPVVEETTLAAILYTSGTTGTSKGVMLTHRNIVSNAFASRSIFRIHPGDRLLSILPLAHTYECTIGFLAPFLQGASITYLDKPPTASVLLPALKKIRPTIMLSVPLIMEKIYRSNVKPKLESHKLYKYPLFRKLLIRIAGMKLRKTFGGRIRFFGIGGAALAPDVEQFLKEARFPYAIGYGLTETSPLVAGCNPSNTHLGSTGYPLEGVEVRIVPAKEGDLEGELQVRGPNVMIGYYKDPERTKEAFTEDGWFRTGDLTRMDETGRIYIRGRLKTMILGPSGENIYPEEIESLINQSNYVQESLVYGDPVGGLTALIQLKPEVLEKIKEDIRQMYGAVEDEADVFRQALEARTKEILESVRKEVNSRLASFARIGRALLQTDPFEKTPTQKIKRKIQQSQ